MKDGTMKRLLKDAAQYTEQLEKPKFYKLGCFINSTVRNWLKKCSEYEVWILQHQVQVPDFELAEQYRPSLQSIVESHALIRECPFVGCTLHEDKSVPIARCDGSQCKLWEEALVKFKQE